LVDNLRINQGAVASDTNDSVVFRVLIGTPAYTWSLDVRYVHALGLTIKLCMERDIDLRWIFPPGDALVQNACNDLVTYAREATSMT